MTGFPSGEWTPLLVGHQWPSDLAVAALSGGQSNREIIEMGFDQFGDVLRDAQIGPLVDQQGCTADDIRTTFRRGEEQARQVAEKNGVKKNAYATARESMLSLRQDLSNLADEGNQAIKAIQNSKEPLEAKVAQVVSVIKQHRALANVAAAKYGGNVLDAIQSILDAEGAGQSARAFAQAHGIDPGEMFRQTGNQMDLDDQVKAALANPGSTADLTGNVGTGPGAAGVSAVPQTTAGQTSSFTGYAGTASASAGLTAVPGPAAGQTANFTGTFGPSPPTAPPPSAAPKPTAPAMPTAPSLPTASAPSTPSLPTGPALPTAPTTSTPPAAPPAPAQSLTPASLLQQFEQGLQSGAPGGLAGDALPSAPMDVQPAPSAPTAPSAAGGVPMYAQGFDAPAPVEHPAAPPPPPPLPPPPPTVSGPTTPTAPVSAAPAGPLPAYGADLRPPAQTTSAPPPPVSSAPASAPVYPSAGQTGLAQPAVVRQPSPLPPAPAPSMGTRELAATAGGAAAGAASAEATARTRLQRLVTVVARQQPKLAWAAGDRDDKTTVLVTDLADGWIPPGIALPSAVSLLEPARRRGDLHTLLGQVSVEASYTPIHYLPEPDDDQPIPTSTRPRRAPKVKELGWELNQATQWRDGLPRLAHTLAKAASTGTGVLDSEVDLLREHLDTVATEVLDSYPEHVDPHQVGTWQLLAAIDALVAGDKTAANYHFAWFRARAGAQAETSGDQSGR